MTPPRDCCSLELARKLETLGVRQDVSQFYWSVLNYATADELPRVIHRSDSKKKCGRKLVAAPTTGELGEMLPPHLQINKYLSSRFLWSVTWLDMKGGSYSGKADTEAEARAKLLIHLLEQKIVTVDSVNRRMGA